MFVTPYATNPPLLPPATLAALTGTLTNGDASGFAPYVVELESGDGLDVEIKISAGTVSVRPYYWVPINKSAFANGGTWVAVGGDATMGSGSGPTSADASLLNGTANGRYQGRSGKRWWCLVIEASAGLTAQWARMEPRRVLVEGA